MGEETEGENERELGADIYIGELKGRKKPCER